jgi:hypothetical protein
MRDLLCSNKPENFITSAVRAIPLAMRPGADMVELFCHFDKICFERDIDAATTPWAWVWTNYHTCEPFYAQKRMEYLRSLGYVMWDKDRLSPLSFFNDRPRLTPQPYDKDIEAAQNELAEHGDGPNYAPAIESISVAEAAPEVLPMKNSFSPAMPDEVNLYTESLSNVNHYIDSSPQEDYSPCQSDPTIVPAIAKLEGYAGPPRARKMARAVSLKAKLLKSQQKFEQQPIEHKAETPMPHSRVFETPIPVRCITPGSTVIPVRAPSSPVSECSSTSSGSINWITLPPLSPQAKQQNLSPYTIAMDCANPAPWQFTPSPNADEEAEHEARPATITTTTTTELAAKRTGPAPYTMSPTDIAKWIETQERRVSSSSSSASSSNSTPAKQQRKKANRKARKAQMELATQQAQEAEVEAERVKVEQAKKECQKAKKELKKLKKEVSIGADSSPGTDAEGKKGKLGSGGRGSADKKKKKAGRSKEIGYVFG